MTFAGWLILYLLPGLFLVQMALADFCRYTETRGCAQLLAAIGLLTLLWPLCALWFVQGRARRLRHTYFRKRGSG